MAIATAKTAIRVLRMLIPSTSHFYVGVDAPQET
jgi:hypothetical protein